MTEGKFRSNPTGIAQRRSLLDSLATFPGRESFHVSFPAFPRHLLPPPGRSQTGTVQPTFSQLRGPHPAAPCPSSRPFGAREVWGAGSWITSQRRSNLLRFKLGISFVDKHWIDWVINQFEAHVRFLRAVADRRGERIRSRCFGTVRSLFLRLVCSFAGQQEGRRADAGDGRGRCRPGLPVIARARNKRKCNRSPTSGRKQARAPLYHIVSMAGLASPCIHIAHRMRRIPSRPATCPP